MRRRIPLKIHQNQNSVITDNDVKFQRFTNGHFSFEWDNRIGKQLLKAKVQNVFVYLRDVL